MTRVTVNLPDELQRALEDAAVVRGKSIDELVIESVLAYGIGLRDGTERLLARARERSGLAEERASELATRETRAARR